MNTRTQARTPLYLLMNSRNVLEYLSSGLVTPIAGFDKYYADTLVFAPGRLPLFVSPPAVDLVHTASREGGHPVLLEIDPGTSAKLAELPSLNRTDHVVLAPPVTLPLSAVRALIFRSDEDLREFCARRYDNVPTAGPVKQIQPTLFDGDLSCDAFKKALDALPATRPVDFVAEDRRRGAISAVAAVSLHAEIPEGIDLVAELLEHGHGIRYGSAATARSVARNSGLCGRATTEQWLFEASVHMLATVQPSESWRPRTLLQELREHLTVAALNDKDRVELDRGLDRIRRVINNEADFESFNPTGAGSVTARALLMVLMRPQLARLLTWLRTQTDADNRTLLTAALFAGTLRGLKRESVVLRSPVLDIVTAQQAASALSGGMFGSRSVQTRVGEEIHGRHTTRVLFADDHPVLRVSTELLHDDHREVP